MDSELVNLIKDEKKSFADFRNSIDRRFENLELKFGARGLQFSPGGENDANRQAGDAYRNYIKTGDYSGVRELQVKNAMSVSSDPSGGYSVVPYLSNEMAVAELALSPILAEVKIQPVDTDELELLVDKDLAGASWVAETQSRAGTTTPEFKKVIIPTCEIYASLKLTQKLLDDSRINMASYLTEKGAQAFSQAIGTALISGSGIGQPKGLLSYTAVSTADGTRTWGQVQYIASGSAGAFKSAPDGGDCLFDCIYALNAQYRQNAKWCMNSLTAAACRKLKDSDGRFLWSDGLVVGEPNRLAGYPVVIAEGMPDISANSLSVMFGDFRRAYCVADRHGLKLLRDPFTDKPNVIFYMYRRLGGALVDSQAVKFLKFSAS